jgi:hypothetical protein
MIPVEPRRMLAWQCSAESEPSGVEEHPLRRSGVYLSAGLLDNSFGIPALPKGAPRFGGNPG